MKKKLRIGQEVRVIYGPHETIGVVKRLNPNNIVTVDMLGGTYACHSSQIFPKN